MPPGNPAAEVLEISRYAHRHRVELASQHVMTRGPVPVPRALPEAGKAKMHLGKFPLARHNCLVYLNSESASRWRFSGPDGEHEVAVSGNLRSNSIEGLRSAVLAGVGASLLPAIIVADDLKSGALVELLPRYATNEMVVQAVYPPGRHISAKVRTFLDFLIERLCTTPAADGGCGAREDAAVKLTPAAG